MKKLLCLIMTIALCLSVVGCEKKTDTQVMTITKHVEESKNNEQNENEAKIIKPYTEVECDEIFLDDANIKVLGYEIYQNEKNEQLIFINSQITNTSSDDLFTSNILYTCFQNGVGLKIPVTGYTLNLLTHPTGDITLRSGATASNISNLGGILYNLTDDIEIDFATDKFWEDKQTVKIFIK